MIFLLICGATIENGGKIVDLVSTKKVWVDLRSLCSKANMKKKESDQTKRRHSEGKD